ncbi:MAG TPA: hypothetical protein VJ892_04010 [Candidatus Absconditabacterales bacterium]|nr:hypothetical protein [Candidatus Absconditabacterales bacterium]
MKDKLILLMGVSGSGKTTLLTELLQTHSQLILVPSYTTRPMRSNEKNGRKYWHISKDDFQRSIDGGEFLEYALVHQKYYYGTKISEIKKAFDKGLIPITELDMNGLEEIRKDNKGIEYVSIFLDLPDDVMVERIKMRGGIYQEEINRRLFSAQKERKLAKKYCDYVLNTDNTLLQNIKNINKLVKKILNGK